MNPPISTFAFETRKVLWQVLKHRHEKKLLNLRQHKGKLYGKSNYKFIRSTVHNFSSYNLSIEESPIVWVRSTHPNYFKPQQTIFCTC